MPPRNSNTQTTSLPLKNTLSVDKGDPEYTREFKLFKKYVQYHCKFNIKGSAEKKKDLKDPVHCPLSKVF